jgi:hypothetical protein
MRVEEGERELESEGGRCGVLLGWNLTYIGVRGCRGGGNGLTTGVMASTPLVARGG